MSSEITDVIKKIVDRINEVGAAGDEVTGAWNTFVGVPEGLKWPVVWCKDHSSLETAPGCLLAQARRE